MALVPNLSVGLPQKGAFTVDTVKISVITLYEHFDYICLYFTITAPLAT